MKVKNNPAGRLVDIIQSAKTKQANIPIRMVWAEVFDLDPSDNAAILDAISGLYKLVAASKAAVERLDNVDVQLHTAHYKRIESIFTMMNFDAAWEHQAKQLDATTLQGLRFNDDLLSRTSGYTELAEGQIDALRNSISQLLEEVIKTSMPADLRALLIRNLEMMRRALLEYRLSGIEGLEAEFDRATGSVVKNSAVLDAASKNKNTSSVVEKFVAVATKMNALISAAKNVKELAPPAADIVNKFLAQIPLP